MALGLTIADNADGTGGVATVSGSNVAATNTLYRASWTGLMGSLSWTASGSRVGDGAIAVALGTGFYVWQVISDLAGVLTVGPLVFQNFTSTTLSLHKRILTAVGTRILSLGLTGITGTKILEKWFPRILKVDHAELPRIYISPQDIEEDSGGLAKTDDVGYPVLICIGAILNRDSVADISTYTGWRRRIAKAFRNQKLVGVSEVQIVKLRYGVLSEWDSYQNQLLGSALQLRCMVRETRGLTVED